MDADVAARLIRESIVPALDFVALELQDILGAQVAAKLQGVRGGDIYDYMHLVAARKAKAVFLHTINFDDFTAIHRKGDPVIRRP